MLKLDEVFFFICILMIITGFYFPITNQLNIDFTVEIFTLGMMTNNYYYIVF